ncbi:MAG TPA: cytochrome c oxidase subunit II [Tepidisphaeraceae bacterium]
MTLLCLAATCSAADLNPGWGKWWLPPDRSTHGPAIDSLFLWIFWITMIAFVLVELVMVIFLIRYRSRPERKKAHFTHGNPRLEMAWTIAPAIILAALALGSKKVWDNYRYSPYGDDPNRATILAIGEQFKWNFIYPGPDGKLGRYLLFPKPYDPKWPVGPDGKSPEFDGVPGPASLPYKEAVASINKYIAQENPLGKDFSDPDGKDDDFVKEPGRELTLPANRPIEVQLSSKDVIHDFFLPNFRVKLDAVPGMRGRLYFTAKMTSAERVSAAAKNVSLDQLQQLLAGPDGGNYVIIIDEKSPGTDQNKTKDSRGWRYVNPATPRTSIIRDGGSFGEADRQKQIIDALKAAGVTDVHVSSDSGKWELVCEELCGQGHNTMTSVITILSNDEYDKKKFDKPSKPPPSTAPAVAMN